MKIAYIHPRQYPSREVNALQAVQMASALHQAVPITFFIPRLDGSVKQLKQRYYLGDSTLHIRSMLFNIIPDRVLLRIPNYFEKAVSFYLHAHPAWRRFNGKKVLFVRDQKELLYWGSKREQDPYFKDWCFVFEAHSTIGLRPDQPGASPVFTGITEAETIYHKRIKEALKGFDAVICVTRAMADDLRTFTEGVVQPTLIRHASPLPRRPEPLKVHLGDTVTIGYTGQISRFKGVDLLLEAVRYLPTSIRLRLVGRVVDEEGEEPGWLTAFTRDPVLSQRIEIKQPVPVAEVSAEIDACDILIQPASTDILNSKYEAPLKSYDYMVRGKPVVAADVPCHRELYRDGETALLYRLDPRSLAEQVMRLVENPLLANYIARNAWKQSENYTYAHRASTIIDLLKRTNRSAS